MVCIRVLSGFSSMIVEHAIFDGFNVLTHVRVHANEEHSSMIVRPTRPFFLTNEEHIVRSRTNKVKDCQVKVIVKYSYKPDWGHALG